MEYQGIVIPVGVRKLVVKYKFYNLYGSLERSKNFYRIKDALKCYNRELEYIGLSEDYEEVGLYYVYDDGILHLIKRFDTVWGEVLPGDQV